VKWDSLVLSAIVAFLPLFLYNIRLTKYKKMQKISRTSRGDGAKRVGASR
jgi:hypothetical protein